MKSVNMVVWEIWKSSSKFLQKGYSISAYDLHDKTPMSNVNFPCSLDKVLEERVIFIAVPIRNLIL